jgi:hypothetical protein
VDIIGSSGAAHAQGYVTIEFDPDGEYVNRSSLLTLLPGIT